MAAGNKVVLTFAGDSTSLERSFGRVGKAAKGMGDETRDSFNRVGESADTLDTRAMGFRDTITGVQDTFRGLTDDSLTLQERMLMLGMGIGDLASGVANFGIQFAKTAAQTVAGWIAMGFQATINAVKMAAAWLISLGPIALVVLAIGAVIGILVALGVGFDDIKRWAGIAWAFVKDKAAVAWNFIKDKTTEVKNWIGARVTDIVGFFTGLPGRMARAAGNMFGWIGDQFKAGINALIRIWNNFKFPSWTVPSVSIPGLGKVGGGTVGGWRLPQIPEFHQGGVMPGAPGTEGLALLQAGERVTPAGRSAMAPNITIIVQGSILSERDLVAVVRKELGNGGFRGSF